MKPGRPLKALKQEDIEAALRVLPLKAVAEALGVCPKTVFNHRRRLGMAVRLRAKNAPP